MAAELDDELAALEASFERVLSTDLPPLEAAARERGLGHVRTPEPER